MRTLTKWVPLFLISFLFLGACNNKNEGTDTAQINDNATVNDLSGDGKTLVKGCTGSGATYGGAVDALKAGNYAESDRQASCVFNASVKVDAKHPDLKAANVALISKFILLLESDQVRDLLLAPNLKSADIFGPTGDPKKLDATLKAATGDKDGYEAAFNFFKAHEDKGENPQAVFETAISLVRDRAPDLHILTKAMAADASFSDIIPKYLVNDSGAEDYTITQAEAAALDFDISMVRFMAEVLQNYNVGISSADSFTGLTPQAIATKLALDLNSDPRALQLKGSSDGSAALPAFQDLLDSAQVGISVLAQKDLQSWAKDLPEPFNLPTKGKTQDQKDWELTILQTQQSLNSGEWVQLTAMGSSTKIMKINAKAFFAKLPDSKSVSGDIVQVDDDDIEPTEGFVVQFLKDFLVEE